MQRSSKFVSHSPNDLIPGRKYLLNREDNSSRYIKQCHRDVLALPRTHTYTIHENHSNTYICFPISGYGILTIFPFGSLGLKPFNRLKSTFLKQLSKALGPTNPCSNHVDMEPFST